jgi:CheY-like chemotaxis protein
MATELKRLRVMVADDDRISRRIMVAHLKRDFELCEVENGEEAVLAFPQFKPDAVLLDVEMPRLNGIDTARELKRLTGDRFIPIFLISGLDEQQTLIRGLAAGADDFLPKPFNASIFRPKLNVFLRLKDMQEKLIAQNTMLDAVQEATRAEHAVAIQVFNRMLKRGALSDPRVKVFVSPLSVFNGDAVLASTNPQGHFRLLAADVSGHGLTGAIGTLPLMTLFHASTSRGDTLSECARGLNLELKTILPPQLFCSAILIELDRHEGTLEVINAGMPDLYVLGNALRSCASQNVPFGITESWSPSIETLRVNVDERIFIMSDGVVELTSTSGELFGGERVQNQLKTSPHDVAFADLLNAVTDFAGQQSDDISLIEVKV